MTQPPFSHRKHWAARFVGIQLLMVAIVLAFPQIVLRDKAPEASSVKEIHIETSPDDNFLPLEWR